jgi:hypothetical protein
MIQKPQSHDENLLSWLHGFLLNHPSLGVDGFQIDSAYQDFFGKRLP